MAAASGLPAQSCLTLVTPQTVACQAPLSMGLCGTVAFTFSQLCYLWPHGQLDATSWCYSLGAPLPLLLEWVVQHLPAHHCS